MGFLQICMFRCFFMEELTPIGFVGRVVLPCRREEELSDEVSRHIRRMKGLGLESALQVEIVRCLIRGRRTGAELAAEIYGSANTESYATDYARIRRDLRRLETRGYVAAATLFGRERPYRLTRHGVSKLASIGDVPEYRLLPRIDVALHALALVTVSFVAAGALGGGVDQPLIILASFISGVSVTRALATLRRVL